MAKPSKLETKTAEPEKETEDPKILTVSQLEKLTTEEKNLFRHSGGTTIENPQ